MKIGIIGWGYVGASTGIGLSEINDELEVHVFDPFKNVEDWSFNQINDLLVKKRKIKQIDSLGEMSGMDLIFLCLPTPESKTGEIDLSIYEKFMPELSKTLGSGDMVIRSTVAPGTTQDFQKKYPKFRFAHHPEFLRERIPLADFLTSDRIIIGSIHEDIKEKLLHLYRNLDTRKIVVTPTASEIIKYAANCYLATKISYFNEIHNICEKHGVDSKQVSEAVAADKRIGYYGVYGGRPFGGTCLPKDISAFIKHAKSIEVEPKVLSAVKEVNDKLKDENKEVRK